MKAGAVAVLIMNTEDSVLPMMADPKVLITQLLLSDLRTHSLLLFASLTYNPTHSHICTHTRTHVLIMTQAVDETNPDIPMLMVSQKMKEIIKDLKRFKEPIYGRVVVGKYT